MKTVSILALWALTASCHIDKLLNGAKTPPSDAPPARVAFSSSVERARAGELITPPVQVTVRDSAGRVTVRDTMVILSLGANPTGDSLRGPKQVRSVNGVATFAELRLDKAADGYRLTAAAPKLEADTSAAFIVLPGPTTQLLFTVQPDSAMQDSVIKPAIQVTAYDSLGNQATNFVASIQLRIGTDGSVTKNAAIVGPLVPAVAGVATFPEVRINKVGIGYTLTAAFGNAAPVDTSVPFNITPAPPPPPTHLGFTQQPQTTLLAGAAITPPVQVAAFDAAEHVVPGFTGAIGLTLGPASNGGTLSGGAPVNAVNGIATFPSLSVNTPGKGYTLRATAPPLTDATSGTFEVRAPPTGSLRVTTTTSGESLDGDGYTVTVDGSDNRAIGINDGNGVTFSGLSVSSHSVELTGVAANCTVTAPNPRDVAVTAGGTATTAFAVSCATPTGSVRVTTSTTGSSLDGDGYTVTVDGSTSQPITINNSTGVTFTGLSVGDHTVQLTGVAGNCSVTAPNPRSVAVTAGATAPTAFAVSCATPSGSLRVTTRTTGSSLDGDGYTVTVDGSTSQPITINNSTGVTFAGLSVGDHTVQLTGVAGNCSVTAPNPRTVTVTAGATAPTAFAVSCTALTGSLRVTTS